MVSRLAFCDVESIRLGTGHGSAIWECAIILREGTGPDVEHLWQLRPSLEFAEANALRIGRYYERCRVADRPVGSGMILAHPKLAKTKQQATPARNVAAEVAQLLDGALLAGANPWFDAGHFEVFLREHGQALAADYHMLDLHSAVTGWCAGRGLPPPAGRKLTDIARSAGVDPDAYDTHTALGDSRLGRDVYDRVMSP